MNEPLKLVPRAASSAAVVNDNFTPETLPPKPQPCPNCEELRRLLSHMRHRVDEVEREYVLLLEQLKSQQSQAAGIEIVSDLPKSN